MIIVKQSLINKTKIFLLNKLNCYLLDAQKQKMILQLGLIGRDSSWQMPIYISGAENVELGEKVSIAAYVHMWGQGGIKIGDRVMIGSNSSITTITHDYRRENMYQTVVKKPIAIEDDVWIGANSVILPGITIGKGAVVGAGSIVTKDVERFSIVFGCPAKHYKFREINNACCELVPKY